MKFIEELIPIQFLATVKGYVKINMIDEALLLLQRLTCQGYKKAYYLICLLHVYLFCRHKEVSLLNRALLNARNFVTAFPDISEGWRLLGEVLLLESFFCNRNGKIIIVNHRRFYITPPYFSREKKNRKMRCAVNPL